MQYNDHMLLTSFHSKSGIKELQWIIVNLLFIMIHALVITREESQVNLHCRREAFVRLDM